MEEIRFDFIWKNRKRFMCQKDSIKPHPSSWLWKAFLTLWLLTELIFLLYKEYLQIDKKTNGPTEKWIKEVKESSQKRK